MRSELRTTLAVLVTAAVLLGSATMAMAADGEAVGTEAAATTPTATPTSGATPTPSPSASVTPTATPTPEPSSTTPEPTTAPPTPEVPTGAFTVSDAQMRWGINDESNNRSFAPGRFNMLSAGKIPDLGPAGTLTQSAWKQADGNVSIEKYLGGAWRPATWAGLKTTSAGTSTADQMVGTNGPFSNHEVVISGGTGTVEPLKGSATIRWTGSFSVVYYSGYSFFYVTDPQLTVDKGVGRLTGTLSGFSSSMDDMTKWEAIAPVPGVVLADLGPVDLTKDLGFTAAPAYTGVSVSVPAGSSPQVRSGDAWGSFPQSFVDYQTSSGAGSYWYSSGGSADAHKVPKPLTVSYAAGSPVKVAPPKSAKTSKKPAIDNDAPDAPKNDTVTAPNLASTLPAPAAAAAPATGAPLPSGTSSTQLRPASTVLGARAAPDGSTDTTPVWVLGGVLLAGALLVAATPSAYAAVRRSS